MIHDGKEVKRIIVTPTGATPTEPLRQGTAAIKMVGGLLDTAGFIGVDRELATVTYEYADPPDEGPLAKLREIVGDSPHWLNDRQENIFTALLDVLEAADAERRAMKTEIDILEADLADVRELASAIHDAKREVTP